MTFIAFELLFDKLAADFVVRALLYFGWLELETELEFLFDVFADVLEVLDILDVLDDVGIDVLDDFGLELLFDDFGLELLFVDFADIVVRGLFLVVFGAILLYIIYYTIV